MRTKLPIGTQVVSKVGIRGQIVRHRHFNNGWHYRVQWENGSSSVTRVGGVDSGWHVRVLGLVES